MVGPNQTPERRERIIKAIRDGLFEPAEADYVDPDQAIGDLPKNMAVNEIPRLIAKLKKKMETHAKRMEFEEAAKMRDEIKRLREVELAWERDYYARIHVQKRLYHCGIRAHFNFYVH